MSETLLAVCHFISDHCYSGEVWIETSTKLENIFDKFVTEKAPRTAICAAKNGTMILLRVSGRGQYIITVHVIIDFTSVRAMCYSSSLHVDGEEDIKTGIDLMEFSKILQSVGC